MRLLKIGLLCFFLGVQLFFPMTITWGAEDESYTNLESKGEPVQNCNTQKEPLPKPRPIPPRSSIDSGLITLWFDDAWITQYTKAFPLMNKYGFKGAIAIAIRFICYSPAFMTWDQLHTLQAKGWETTAHSMSHSCDMGFYTTKDTLYELSRSQQVIRQHGLRADHFVMPCGFTKEQIEDAFIDAHPPIIQTAKKYYASYRTTTTGVNPLPLPDPYNLYALQWRNTTTDKEIQEAIDKAKRDKTWLIFVFHQIDNSNQTFAIPPEKFDHILQLIKASQLPVVLPSQVIHH